MTRHARRLPPLFALSRQLPVVAGYLLLYLLLDWVSYIRPLQGFNITPWNPQPALAIGLLLWSPARLWLVWLGLLAAEVLVRGVPGHWWAGLIATLALTWLYAGVARALAARLGPVPQLATLRDLAWFTVIAGAGALLCGLAYVTAYAAPSLGSLAWVVEAVVRYWIGDFVGLLITLPILLILLEPGRRQQLGEALRRPPWLLVLAAIGLLLWTVIGHGGGVYVQFLYLLFIPVVLTSAAQGVQGAVLAASLTQVGLIVLVQTYASTDFTVFELQLLMATITMTGLLIGVLVDEKARTAQALRESMRLATAGQMSAALAHELNQPLTALSNYALAAQLLVAEGDGMTGPQRERLNDVARHIVADANRAAQVVKRLRDFFHTGATQLQRTAVPALVEEALALHRQRADLLDVTLAAQLPAALPEVWMDPLQIGVVLRNLLDNALYAVTQTPGARRVEVVALRQGRFLRIEVRDSGPGVTADRLDALFEGGGSDKPGGMGIGLGICRAIVEAHGGKLWAVPGSGGQFCFTLPLGEQTAHRNSDAP